MAARHRNSLVAELGLLTLVAREGIADRGVAVINGMSKSFKIKDTALPKQNLCCLNWLWCRYCGV